MLGEGWAFIRSSWGAWLPQPQEACHSPPAAQGWEDRAVLRSDMAAGRRVSGTSRPRLDLTQPKRSLRAPRGGLGCPPPLLGLLGSILDTLCLPSYQPGWRLFPSQLLSQKALPTHGGGGGWGWEGRREGPQLSLQEGSQLSGAFTPHLIPAPACDVGLVCSVQGEEAG